MKNFLDKCATSATFTCAAVLMCVSSVQASVMETLDFETPQSALVLAQEEVDQGKFWTVATGVGAQPGDLVGAIMDGNALADTCSGLACPINNPSHFMAALNDGLFFFGRKDNNPFQVKSIDASFIGIGGLSYPLLSGLLILTGYDDFDNIIGRSEQLGLSGPNEQGNFNFSTFNLSELSKVFSESYFSYVQVRGYACDTTGNCISSGNLANYAVDNIATSLPEPSSWLLLGLGTLVLIARRRVAAI
jgi:PEP-CTERM motif